ncbi:MAG: ribose 5-phosphate isomerase B [SAR202 cluster bacterium]|nr:ribose 5-phosphate isomerase B [Chloroflexota bacterium]MQG51564.1 ribose 5-phosphate isomerase B [SAR202 cluster bacterium]
MKIALGSDHAGFEIKEEIKSFLTSLNIDFVDLGASEFDALDDYPDFAKNVGYSIRNGEAEKGIIVCGSGVGASITANKIKGVRAGLCHDGYSAHQGVEHDDMNVLCIGSRIIGIELIKEIIISFINAKFSGEERHSRRLQKLLDIEASE